MSTSNVIRLPALLPHQLAIKRSFADGTRFVVWCAGRRLGKSTLGIDLAINNALRGGKAAYFGLTYKSLSTFYEMVRGTLSSAIASTHSTQLRINLRTSGTIEFWSALHSQTAARIRGRSFDFIVIDEAAFIPNLNHLFYQVLRPTLIDRQGKALICSSPNGYNDFHNFFSEQPDTSWLSVRNTTYDNPLLPRTEVDALSKSLPERVYRAEILAEFVETEGGVFSNLSSILVNETPKPDTDFVAFGIDLGRSNDNTVICVMRGHSIVELIILNNTSFYQQRQAILQAYQQYRPESVVIERNGLGQQLAEELVSDGIPLVPFTTTNDSKKMLIEDLAAALDNRLITMPREHPNSKQLIEELSVYESKRTSLERVSYSAPSGYHDDCVMALALAYRAVKYGSRSIFA